MSSEYKMIFKKSTEYKMIFKKSKYGISSHIVSSLLAYSYQLSNSSGALFILCILEAMIVHKLKKIDILSEARIKRLIFIRPQIRDEMWFVTMFKRKMIEKFRQFKSPENTLVLMHIMFL